MKSFKNLTEAYNAYFKEKPRIKKNKEPSLKPSMLGTPCMRKLYYSYNNVDPDYGFSLYPNRIAKQGKVIGALLEKIFNDQIQVVRYRKKDGTFYKSFDSNEPDYEFRVKSDKLNIKMAKIDLVCILDKKLWNCEFKTVSKKEFETLRQPRPKDIYQATVYLYLFNEALKNKEYSHIEELDGFERASGVRYGYYCRDNAMFKEFVITENDPLFVQIVKKIQELKWYSDKDILPPMTPDFCKSCEWRDKCAKNLKASDLKD